jgi:hypothetical protein
MGPSLLLRARGLDSPILWLPRATAVVFALVGRLWLLEETQDREEIIERVAALDIGKATLVCCVRVPDQGRPGRRLQEVRTYSTMTRSLAVMAERLRGLGVTRVVMEATSDYWKPAFYLLEGYGFEAWLVNARRQAPAGAAEDRPVGRGVVVQGRRAADDPPQLCATATDPPVAGSDPLPGGSGGRSGGGT